jgi:DeoR/GlpR family transcriptional regulator of sugar metabolism
METNRGFSNTERQDRMLHLLDREGRMTIPQICELFHVSQATARRDLETLSAQGHLRRVHGGAITLRQASPELPFIQRSSEQSEEKIRIGARAADLVMPGQTVFLGSGTTVLELARNLRSVPNLTVITNSLQVMNALAASRDITLICLGGYFRQSELSFIGHITILALAEVRCDQVFMSVRAIDLQSGLTNANLSETLTDRSILHITRSVVVLADHTKCGRVSTAFLAPVTAINALVTDTQTPNDFVTGLEALGVHVLRA